MKSFFLIPFSFFSIKNPNQFFSIKNPNQLDVMFFSTLVILLPIALLTGPALPDIFLSLVACYFLVKSIICKAWHYYKNPIVICFLFFSAYGIIRSLFYELPWLSLSNEGSLFYFRYIFFSLGVCYLLDQNPNLSKHLLIVSLICLSIVCLDGLFQYFMGVNFLGYPKFDDFRLTGIFKNEPIIGRYISNLSIFSFCLMYQIFQKSKITIIYISSLLLLLCGIVIFLSGERAPLFSYILFFIIVSIFYSKYRISFFVILIVKIIIILGISEVNPNAKERMLNFTINQITQNQIKFSPYSPHHEEHYISSLKIFMDNPLFGVGTNTYRFECNKFEYRYTNRSCSTHPHNYYLQILAELGLTGFLAISSFFLFLSYMILRQLFYLIKKNQQKFIPLYSFTYIAILFVHFWPLIPHMSYYNNWNNVFIMLPLGFFMKYLYDNQSNGNT